MDREPNAQQVPGQPTVMKLFAAIIGAATLPLAQIPNLFDMEQRGAAR
jgi:hypothetical protein